MIRNVEFPEIKELVVAIVPESNEENPERSNWSVFIINTGKTEINNVMVNSKGFGKVKDEEVKTTTLRRHLDDIEAESFLKVEPIQEELFVLNNEYWVSFYREGKLYDKKYLFTTGSISSKFLTDIPIMNVRGICHP